MANKALALSAHMVVKQMDKSIREDISDDIVNNVYGFAGGAVAASLIPVPGLDVALATADIWMMYARINSLLCISFSENQEHWSCGDCDPHGKYRSDDSG